MRLKCIERKSLSARDELNLSASAEERDARDGEIAVRCLNEIDSVSATGHITVLSYVAHTRVTGSHICGVKGES